MVRAHRRHYHPTLVVPLKNFYTPSSCRAKNCQGSLQKVASLSSVHPIPLPYGTFL
jgi:hypothetical protein